MRQIGLGGVAVLAVPERVDAEHLQVDAHAVHRGEARRELLLDLQKVLGHAFTGGSTLLASSPIRSIAAWK